MRGRSYALSPGLGIHCPEPMMRGRSYALSPGLGISIS